MPGLKTKTLSELNYSLFQLTTKKVLLSFFNRYEIENIRYECRTKFEKINPYGEGYDKNGWIHSDDSNKLSAIYYINGVYEEGTSFYVKKKILEEPDLSLLDYKHKLFMGFKPDVQEYNTNLKKHNDQFLEILNVPLIKNRIVIFDSSIYHKTNGLGSLDKPRLIQTYFFGNIYADHFPISEIRKL